MSGIQNHVKMWTFDRIKSKKHALWNFKRKISDERKEKSFETQNDLIFSIVSAAGKIFVNFSFKNTRILIE